VPSHPQLTRKAAPAEQEKAIDGRMKMLRRFLRPDGTYLEVGPGDCALAVRVANHVERVYAVDVSLEIGKGIEMPANFTHLISDGSSIPVDEAVDIAFSDQLMEHLHPDDAQEQLQNIFASLKDGGIYVCITPSRLSGPHDVSQFFDEVATGFHLREYTVRELSRMFRQVGFGKVRALIGFRGKFVSIPTLPIGALEYVLERLPVNFTRQLARGVLRPFLGINLVGTK
jgi:SAM-dependent methyltransferase